MKKLFIHIVAIFTLVLGATGAWAGTAPRQREIVAGDTPHDLNQTWDVAPDAHIALGNVRGKLSVSGWDKNEVALGGSLGAGSTLEVTGDAKSLTLRVKATHSGWLGGDGPDHDSELILQVPRNAALELHVVSADATVAAMAGKSLAVGSVSGTLTLASAAPQIDVDSVSGDVNLSAPKPDVDARTHIQTVSGDIRAKNLAGEIKLETVSGTIGCVCGVVGELETGSVSGDADIAVAPSAQAHLHLESMSGDIRLHLPANLSARIDAATFSGGIESDFGTAHEKEHGSGSSLQASIGGGDAQLRVQTFSGDVRLRKQ